MEFPPFSSHPFHCPRAKPHAPFSNVILTFINCNCFLVFKSLLDWRNTDRFKAICSTFGFSSLTATFFRNQNVMCAQKFDATHQQSPIKNLRCGKVRWFNSIFHHTTRRKCLTSVRIFSSAVENGTQRIMDDQTFFPRRYQRAT